MLAGLQRCLRRGLLPSCCAYWLQLALAGVNRKEKGELIPASELVYLQRFQSKMNMAFFFFLNKLNHLQKKKKITSP